MSIFPIYIATKGRAGKAAGVAWTMVRLDEEDIPYTLFVEPQEVDAYAAAHPKATIVDIEANDRGLPYVRQFILDYARERNPDSWYWLLDDDIKRLSEVVEGKVIDGAFAYALEGAQKHFADNPRVGLAGLEYRQFAWSATVPVSIGSYCDVAVCVHTGRTAFCDYRTELPLKGDREFTLQVLASGYLAAKVNAFAFDAPKNGSNGGGLQEVYARKDAEMRECLRMAELWAGICEPVVKKDGRIDLRIRWNLLLNPGV